MKNTALLIDTNVILNYLTGRSDQYLDSSIKIVKKCASGECTGYIAFHTLSTLWYVLRKWSDKERRDSLKLVCQIFTVASASQSEILAAVENDKFIITQNRLLLLGGFFHSNRSDSTISIFDARKAG